MATFGFRRTRWLEWADLVVWDGGFSVLLGRIA
jgi:hypothetical protein